MGAWLFQNRGWLPVPVLLLLLWGVPQHWVLGLGITALGEGLRLWAVGHIGRKSRTRGADVGPLTDTGPYSLLRNPLYLGNLLIWVGMGALSGAVWVGPLMFLYYQPIIAWEEGNLRERLGEPYEAYRKTVPRWGVGRFQAGAWDGREALRSERSTLLALLLVLGLFAARGA